MEEELRQELFYLADKKYREFSSRLIPGARNIIGVRTPALRKIAKRIAAGDFRAFIDAYDDEYLEETLLKAFVIGYSKCDAEEKLRCVASFVPKIDCWSLCDGLCSVLKFTEKNKGRVFEFLSPYFHSSKEFEVRFAAVMALSYFVEPEYALTVLGLFDEANRGGYYAKMAIAWAVSIYFIKLPELTFAYLKSSALDDFTFNKALQKITESYRVDDGTKAVIRSMKR